MKTGLLWILRIVATAGGCFDPTRIGPCPCVGIRILQNENCTGYNPWSGSDDIMKGIAKQQHRVQTGT